MDTKTLSSIRKIASVNKSDAKRIAEEMSKISNAVRYYLPERAPFDFQAEYLDDWSTKWLIADKSRQVGWSQILSYRAAMRAIAIPNYRKIFCSLNLEDAREKISYAREIYDAVAQIEDVPSKTEDRKLSMRLSNGAVLISAFSPRGNFRADISLDEFAYMTDAQEIYTAALPILIAPGSQFDAGSSARHSQTLHKKIFRGDDGKFTHFKRIQIFWWDSPIHCTNVNRARNVALKMPTDERVSEYGSTSLKQIFDNMPLEDFQQEFELREQDDDAALLDWNLIHDCTPTGDHSITKYDDFKELIENTKNSALYAGFDIGRWKDRSELTIFEERDKHLYERMIMTLTKVTFDKQEKIIDLVCGIPQLRRLELDATGMGEPVAEKAAQRYPGKAVPVKFSHQKKATLATTLKMYMQKGSVTFYPDKDRMYQMHSIKKKISLDGNILYRTDTSIAADGKKQHHGDAFWSRALGLHAHAELHAGGSVNIYTIFTTEEDDYAVIDSLGSLT